MQQFSVLLSTKAEQRKQADYHHNTGLHKILLMSSLLCVKVGEVHSWYHALESLNFIKRCFVLKQHWISWEVLRVNNFGIAHQIFGKCKVQFTNYDFDRCTKHQHHFMCAYKQKISSFKLNRVDKSAQQKASKKIQIPIDCAINCKVDHETWYLLFTKFFYEISCYQ